MLDYGLFEAEEGLEWSDIRKNALPVPWDSLGAVFKDPDPELEKHQVQP
jgi:hypothetical protein